MRSIAPDRSTLLPLVVVTALFFLWGFITVLVDALIPRLREIFALTYFQAGLVQFAFFIAYGLFSIPSGALLSRIGYRNGMIAGLTTMGIGCLLFWPAAGWRLFPLFLLGTFVLAAGMTVLQVAANPYVAVLGDERTASSRLNLAQAFNSVGTTIAPIVGAMFLLSDRILDTKALSILDGAGRKSYLEAEASAVQLPFIIIAGVLFIVAVAVRLVRLPGVGGTASTGTYAEALKRPRLMWGAMGIFLYVGAEVAIGSYLVSYFLSLNLPEIIGQNTRLSAMASGILGRPLAEVDGKAVAGAFVALYWGGAMVGRFIGAWLTRIFRPSMVLALFGMSAIALIVISMNSQGLVAMWSILAVGLFNSIMFPTIFTNAIEGLGVLKPQGSGILCTAICGGALIPPMLGWLADGFGFQAAFTLVLVCYAYIVHFALRYDTRTT